MLTEMPFQKEMPYGTYVKKKLKPLFGEKIKWKLPFSKYIYRPGNQMISLLRGVKNKRKNITNKKMCVTPP